MSYLQTSQVAFLIFSHIVAVKQIHAQRGSSYMSLLLHTVPSVKSTPTSSQLFHRENAAEKYQFSNRKGKYLLVFVCSAFLF